MFIKHFLIYWQVFLVASLLSLKKCAHFSKSSVIQTEGLTNENGRGTDIETWRQTDRHVKMVAAEPVETIFDTFQKEFKHIH